VFAAIRTRVSVVGRPADDDYYLNSMTAMELTPILNISDWDASVAWFERLGFTRGFDWADEPNGPPTFGAMLWGEIEIFQCVGAQGRPRRARRVDRDLRRRPRRGRAAS
jgi:hypothetical protein